MSLPPEARRGLEQAWLAVYAHDILSTIGQSLLKKKLKRRKKYYSESFVVEHTCENCNEPATLRMSFYGGWLCKRCMALVLRGELASKHGDYLNT